MRVPSLSGAGRCASLRELIEKVQKGDAAAEEELHARFEGGIRFFLRRRVDLQDVEDKLHDILVIVIDAIRRGAIREPERLPGFVRTVVMRQAADYIEAAIERRTRLLPLEDGIDVPDERMGAERDAVTNEEVRVMRQLLDSLSERDRDVLTRFYVLQQSPDKIRADMGLSATQFRLLKSRAKSKFERMARAVLNASADRTSCPRRIPPRSTRCALPSGITPRRAAGQCCSGWREGTFRKPLPCACMACR